MQIFHWTLQLSGYPIKAACRQFEAIKRMPCDEWVSWQERQRSEILAFHAAHNHFYQAFLLQHGIHDVQTLPWTHVPVMRKADIQVPLVSRLSRGYTLRNVFKNNTSGSSGTPFHFARDRFCHAITWACYIDRYGWHGLDFNRSLQARFYGIPLSRMRYWKEKIKDRLALRERFPVFNLEDKVCHQYVERFSKRPFVYLNGYASSLVLFAKYCISQGIVLRQVCPTLRICITTSEMCDAADRAVMEQGFGVRVVNEYGAAELDLLAFEDPQGHWLLNEENLFIEVLDDDDNPLPDGQTGKIVVTSLYNKAHPMIRYELGDRGAIVPGKRINCHRQLQHLEGRTNDIAMLPSGKKVPGLTFYYVTKALLSEGAPVKEFVIHQLAPTQFSLLYVSERPLTQAEQQAVIKLMDSYLEPGLALTFQQMGQIPRTRAGKLRQFENRMSA